MRNWTRTVIAFAAAAGLAVTMASPAAAKPFPHLIELPENWNAEGINIGPGHTVYSGSLATGAIWEGSLRSGEGDILVPPHDGRSAVGLKHHLGLLFVAGGATGQGYVYNARTGADVTTLQFPPAPNAPFINDVVVTTHAAWFTDSFNAILYKVPLRGGKPAGDPQPVPLSGDWQQVEGFNANGIDATPNGKWLLVINSTTGTVYRVDPKSGEASEIDTDADLTSGDGILLVGRKLVVVRNFLNEVAVVQLSPDLSSATLATTLTDPDHFAVPTTVARFGSALYVVNARFGLPEGPFTIVRVDGS